MNLAAFRRKVKTAFALSSVQRRAIFQAHLLLWQARFFLSVAPAFYTRRSLALRPGMPPEKLTAGEAARCFLVARRYLPFQASCLVSSLAFHRLLCSNGLPSSVNIGVRALEGRLEAHAWCGGSSGGGPFTPVKPFARGMKPE